MEGGDFISKHEFRQMHNEEWALMWGERFDDRFRGEGIAVREYPLLPIDLGLVLSGSREAVSLDF